MSHHLAMAHAAHTSDVRATCLLYTPPYAFATSGRDKTILRWFSNRVGGGGGEGREGNGEDGALHAPPITVDHWIGSLLGLKRNQRSWGLIAGCHDANLRIYHDNGTLEGTLGGHAGPVNSLCVVKEKENDDEIVIASGSWDGTVRIWNLMTRKCLRVLDHKENAVSVAAATGRFFNSGEGNEKFIIVTGSSGIRTETGIDGFRVRVWGDDGNVKSELGVEAGGHSGPIRCVCGVEDRPNAFLSTSNDGTTRRVLVDMQTGKVSLDTVLVNPPGFEGGPAFNFCVSSMGNGQAVVGSDDLTARIWNVDDGFVLQQIDHPAVVWSTLVLPNGDVVTGAADGFVRIFSTSPERTASLEDTESFQREAELAHAAMRAKLSGGFDVSKLIPIENAPPGTHDGQSKVFRKQNVAFAYQWMAVSGTWMELGEAMGMSGNKEMLDGKEYDKVVSVEVERPGGGGGVVPLKLGFNNEDNPWVVATEFVKRHDLNEENTPQIVDFINKQRGGGGSTMMPSVASQVSTTTKKSFPLSFSLGLAFDKGNIDKAFAKLVELSLQQADPVVNDPKARADLEQVIATLKQTSRYHATSFTDSQIDLFTQRLSTWNLKDRFPALDLARAVLTHPDGGKRFSGKRGSDFFLHACTSAAAPGAPLPVQLTGLRVATNFFRFFESSASALDVARSPSAPIEMVGQALASSFEGGVRFALSTLLLNCANALAHERKRSDRDSAVVSQCARAAVVILRLPRRPDVPDDELTAYRAVIALGCVACVERSIVTSDILDELKPLMEGQEASVRSAFQELSSFVTTRA